MDITLFTSQGIVPYVAEWTEYNSNPRNAFRYKIKFKDYTFNSFDRFMIGNFIVERYAQQNGEWVLDLDYIYDSVADDKTYVDKLGNIVPQYLTSTDTEGNEIQIPNPDVWGTEYERIAVLFSSPIEDSLIMAGYQQILFNRGVFDFLKRR